MSRYKIFFAAIFIPVSAAANPGVSFELLQKAGGDVGFALGAAEYCGIDASRLSSAFTRGLDAFGLRPTELQAILATLEQQRQEARSTAASKLAGGACGAERTNTVREAIHSMETAWYQIVQGATGVDVRAASTPSTAQFARSPQARAQATNSNSSQVRSAQAQPSGAHQRAGQENSVCDKGRAVSILNVGQWFPGKVIDGPDNLGNCKVSYDGFGPNWDEWVSVQRLRPAASTQTAPAAQAQPTSVPPGKYGCYTFDAGQTNYTYTDVVIRDARQYSVGNKSGTYHLAADGRMTFTGTLSNAVGKFSIKSTGKAQIDLIFNGDPRSSMSCVRS